MKSVVVIGNFDGVHSGHAEVLHHAQSLAPSEPLVVVTFWPHPTQVLRPEQAPKLLSRLGDRIDLLKAAGAAEVRVVQFTRDVSTWSPEEFVRRVIEPLDPSHVVVGENFRFGYRAQGSVETLRRLGEGHFVVDAMPLVAIEGDKTCSTLIRQCLEQGDVEQAARHLGRNFRLRGVVVMGDQRGRELGFPTANLPIGADMAVPADGVYAGWLTRLDEPGAQPMPAAISVGSNPTFQGLERRVETYVLDRDDLQLYGVKIAVDFVSRLRGQVTFGGIDDLVRQMHDDVQRTREVLGA